MADFQIRSDSVDVEQIMQQIRARIKEKRGVDYTEEQIRELASVRLEKFLDPKNLRSDLLEQFRRSRPALPEPPKEPPPVEAPYSFDEETLFQSHRPLLRMIRKLLKPILKLFFNPNKLSQIMHTQAQFNVDMLKRDLRRRVEFQQQVASFERSRGEWNVLYYEVLHNLVIETTRSGIELKNLKMRVEALASRLDFTERRVRALEGVVQYRPEAVRSRDRDRDRHRSRDSSHAPTESADSNVSEMVGSDATSGGSFSETGGSPESAGRRRRRRRRGRRGLGVPAVQAPGTGQLANDESIVMPDEPLESDEAYEAREDEVERKTAGEPAESSGSPTPQPDQANDTSRPDEPNSSGPEQLVDPKQHNQQ